MQDLGIDDDKQEVKDKKIKIAQITFAYFNE
jgi:hypothetical protein